MHVTWSRRSARIETSRNGADEAGQGRLRALDGLRFFAAAAVVGYHFTAHGSSVWGPKPAVVFPTLSEVTVYGALGVDLFFVISGFVILMTAWGQDIPNFVASRISRLFPAYWAGVLLTSLLLFVLWPERNGLTPLDALVNLTMIQKVFSVPHVDAVYWTLWVELRFYLLIGVFALMGVNRRRVIAFAALWPLVGRLAMRSDESLLSALLITEYAPLFAGGMLLYLIYREGHALLPWLLVGMNAILAVQSQVFSQVTSLSSHNGVDVSPLIVGLLLVGAFVAVAVVTLTPVASVDWRWLTTLGALTYPLYLVHEYWGWWVIDRLNPLLGSYPALLVATGVVLGLACLVHYGVERRAARPLRRAVLGYLDGSGARRRREVPADTVGAADDGPVSAQEPEPASGSPRRVAAELSAAR